MSLYLTTSGRSVAPEFPDDLSPWPELANAVENARRLEHEYQEAGSAQAAAEEALEAAIADDRARVADAKASLAEAERQRSAADDARQRGAEIVVETLKQHRAAYVRAAEDAVESARIDEAAALTAYLGAVERSTVAGETLAWLQGFPEKRNYRPNTTHVRHVGRLEPISFSDLVYGLKVRCGLAEPPPRTLLEHVRAAEPAPEIVGGETP